MDKSDLLPHRSEATFVGSVEAGFDKTGLQRTESFKALLEWEAEQRQTSDMPQGPKHHRLKKCIAVTLLCLGAASLKAWLCESSTS